MIRTDGTRTTANPEPRRDVREEFSPAEAERLLGIALPGDNLHPDDRERLARLCRGIADALTGESTVPVRRFGGDHAEERSAEAIRADLAAFRSNGRSGAGEITD
jgi:hypothetical protein